MNRGSRRKGGVPYILIGCILFVVIIVALLPFESNANNDCGDVSVDLLEQVVIPDSIPAVLLTYEGFNVCFNSNMHLPNYVVWTLEPDETDGDFTRKNVNFSPDTSVEGCATLADYRNSGYDRGHMAPAADMKWSEKSMSDCHLLTNICPQDKSLNTGAWSTIEKNSRKWAKKHGRLIIVCGPILSDKIVRRIGETQIPVPERYFKVIYAPEANPPMGIGFIMPNGYVEGGAQSTVVSIDEVEAVTGFDFFSALPDDIESQVETMANLMMWNR